MQRLAQLSCPQLRRYLKPVKHSGRMLTQSTIYQQLYITLSLTHSCKIGYHTSHPGEFLCLNTASIRHITTPVPHNLFYTCHTHERFAGHPQGRHSLACSQLQPSSSGERTRTSSRRNSKKLYDSSLKK